MRFARSHKSYLAAAAGCVLLSPVWGQQADPASKKSGKTHFQSYCAACHQYDGQGAGAAPPLDGSPWVTGPAERLIKIILHGVRGPMEIHGKTYNREMPGFGKMLSDAEAASLAAFVRRRFGAVKEPVTPEQVRRIREAHQDRAEYWHVDELLDEP